MERPRLYIALDVNGTTYHDKPGAEPVIKFSPHVTREGYEYTKDLLKRPQNEIAKGAREAFVLVRPVEPRQLDLGKYIYGLERSLLEGVHEVTLDPTKRNFLGKDIYDYMLESTMPDALGYAWVRDIPVFLNTGAKFEGTNPEALLLMAQEDGLLGFLNPDFPVAMRPATVSERLKDRIKEGWSTPDSKALGKVGIEAEYGVEVISFTDTPEDREGIVIVGGDVGLNATQEVVNSRRKKATPEHVKYHLDPDAQQLSPKGLGRSIYNIGLADFMDWKLGVKELPLKEVGRNEYEVTEPNFAIVNVGIPVT